MLGTLFPDIRALKVIEREQTHFTGVTYDQIKQVPDSFRRGFLLHSLIDEVREDYVQSKGAYRGLPTSYLTTVALKVCEDIALYDKVKDWHEYIEYLNHFSHHEEQFGIPAGAIQTWHKLHGAFFANSPDKNITTFAQGIGLGKEEVDEVTRLMAIIRESKVVDTYLYDFYDNLEDLLEK